MATRKHNKYTVFAREYALKAQEIAGWLGHHCSNCVTPEQLAQVKSPRQLAGLWLMATEETHYNPEAHCTDGGYGIDTWEVTQEGIRYSVPSGRLAIECDALTGVTLTIEAGPDPMPVLLELMQKYNDAYDEAHEAMRASASFVPMLNEFHWAKDWQQYQAAAWERSDELDELFSDDYKKIIADGEKMRNIRRKYRLDKALAGQPGRVVISVNLSRSPYDPEWQVEVDEINGDLIEGREDRLSMLIGIDQFFDGAIHAYLGEHTTEWSWYSEEAKQFARDCQTAKAAFDAAAAEQQKIEQVKAMSIEFAHRASEGEFEADADLSAEMPEALTEDVQKVWRNVRQLVALGEVEPSWGFDSSGWVKAVTHDHNDPLALTAAAAAAAAWSERHS